jgi:hypothetical protein
MKAYFHTLEPVVMPREDYLDEHSRLVNALSSGNPKDIMKELVEQRKDLSKALHGGRAGVSRASGFVMRAMAENKAKHSGQYKNPTFPLAPGSKMNKPIEFDWRKLANSSQGGLWNPGKKVHWGEKGQYGASPFVLHHFSGESKPFAKGNRKDYPKETDVQRNARMLSLAKNLMKKAGQLVQTATGSPKLVISEIPQELKEHFGNTEAKEAEKPESPKQPVSPPENVIETEAPKEAPVVEPVVAEKVKKVRAKKVAESPTPSNPAQKKVWTEEDVATNPILVNSGSYGWYMEHNERWRKLYLFGLNNPSAKLKDAIEYLKENKIGQGYSSSLISPIWKQVKDAVDEDVPKLEDQQKVVQNPAFASIKEKFDSLLASRKARKFENIDKLSVPALRGVDLKPYTDALDEYRKITGGVKMAESYKDNREIIVHTEGGWEVRHLTDGGKYIRFPQKYNIGFDAEEFYKTKKLDLGELKNKELEKSPDKLAIPDLKYDDKLKYYFNSDNVKIYIPSEKWKNAITLPGHEYIPNQYSFDHSNRKKREGKYRVFQNKEIYEHFMKITVGKYIESYKEFEFKREKWMDTDEYNRRKRTLFIGKTKTLKHIIKDWNKYDYTFTVGGVKYVSISATLYKDLYPEEVPEAKITEFSPDLFGGGEYILNKVSEADAKDPEEITKLPIRNKERYEKAKTALLEALSKYTVPPITTRMNAIGKESGKMLPGKGGGVGRGVAFGFGNNRRGYDYYVKNKQHPEVYKALVELGESIVPKGWDFQTIQLNHNVKAKKHNDKHNVGKSVIIGIGDYKGGELRVFSPDSSKHHDYNLKDNPVMFNGAVLPHEGQPFENPTEYKRGHGRYTIVYFRHKYKPKGSNVGVGSGIGKGLRQPSKAEIEDMFV